MRRCLLIPALAVLLGVAPFAAPPTLAEPPVPAVLSAPAAGPAGLLRTVQYGYGPPRRWRGPPPGYYRGPPPRHWRGPPPGYYRGPPPRRWRGPPPGYYRGPPRY